MKTFIAEGYKIYTGSKIEKDGKTLLNALRLRKLLKHLNPIACGIKRSFGFGDRLGLATPGHIKVIEGRDISTRMSITRCLEPT